MSSAKVFEEVLHSLREEIDEHREVINENTNDIQTNFEFLCELEKKVERVQDRLDELCLLVSGSKQVKEYRVESLSGKEKEVFLALLTLTESFQDVTYAQVGAKLCVSTQVVAGYVNKLQEKGIPLVKKVRQGQVFVRLEKEFRETQIKKNVVGLEVPLTHWL